MDNIRVNTESLYDINYFFSINYFITVFNVDKDKLIKLPSYIVFPVAYVLDNFSLPAKSTNDNVPFFTVAFASFYSNGVYYSTII